MGNTYITTSRHQSPLHDQEAGVCRMSIVLIQQRGHIKIPNQLVQSHKSCIARSIDRDHCFKDRGQTLNEKGILPFMIYEDLTHMREGAYGVQRTYDLFPGDIKTSPMI
jgi:hypothetical protein